LFFQVCIGSGDEGLAIGIILAIVFGILGCIICVVVIIVLVVVSSRRKRNAESYTVVHEQRPIAASQPQYGGGQQGPYQPNVYQN